MLIATLVLTVSFLGKNLVRNLSPANRFTIFCVEFSLGLYLTHYIVLRVFRYRYKDVYV